MTAGAFWSSEVQDSGFGYGDLFGYERFPSKPGTMGSLVVLLYCSPKRMAAKVYVSFIKPLL